MNRPTLPPDDSWESDDVWKLLDQASPPQPGAGFVDQAVRMARQLPEYTPWWRRLLAPAPLTGFAAAVAALALSLTVFHRSAPSAPPVATVEIPAQSDSLDSLQDLAETETLLVAADHLDDFSDQELASLIGF